MLRRILLAVAVAATGASPVLAQDAAAPDIVVVGERLQEVSRTFATEIGAPSLREDQLARWDDEICVGASGLSAEQSGIVVDRISERAAEVGLRVGEPGCRASIMVIFASDSDAVARTLVNERRDVMGYYTNDGVSTGGREGLEAFANTPRAVRWWQVARNVTVDGRVLDNPNTTPGGAGAESGAANQAAASGGVPTGIGAYDGAQAVRTRGSRLYRDTRQDLNYIVIIVDTQRIAEFPTSAVLDYVAMVALAQVNPTAQPQTAPSILNLFTAPIEEVQLEMTDWDLAYLRGLYRAARDAPNAGAQVDDIARSMAAELSEQR